MAALPALTLNGDLSMTINRNWSAHGELSLNPWRIESYRLQHLMIRPQVRYWFAESYRSWFVGAHAFFAGYHIGVPAWMRGKWKGVAAGGGLDAGYHLPIGTKWNIEFALGASLLWADYDILECKNCGEKLDEKRGIYFAPTKASISLVYLF